MKTVELLHQKIDDLPESAYLTLLDYVEFLLHKYQPEQPQDEETARLTQELLVKRYESYRRNPEHNSKSLADFDSGIRGKFGWND